MVPFEVLIRDQYVNLCGETKLSPIENKHVLSIMNDFENKAWRYPKFQNFIWDNVAESALSAKDRLNLISQPHTAMTEAAQKLRLTDKEKDDIGKGSEIAEIILYGVMRHYYNALPVVPKIFYKQNSADNAKGADSVHIVLEGDDFSVWFGEAKFYNSIEDARLDAIIKSVENSLQTDKLKKENSIITGLKDLDDLIADEGLRAKIKATLSTQESIDKLKPKLHIPILLLHECKITNGISELTDEYKAEIHKYHMERATAYFSKQIAKLGDIGHYDKITFHIILFPVPQKTPIVERFVANVEHYKSNSKQES